MIKNKQARLRSLAFTLIIFSFFLTACQSSQKTSTIKINNHVFNVEIVDEQDERAQGLSGRESLDPDTGMLFIFDDYNVRNFWMKDMKISIDIIWIQDDQIVGFEKNVPLPVMGEDLIIYQSPSGVNRVLELNSGLSDELGLKIGDRAVQLTIF